MKRISKIIILAHVFIISQVSFISSFESRREIVSALFKSIESWYGSEYILGGESKKGVDCSGLVQQVYREVFNIDLPRRVSQQKNQGELVKNKLEPGDLVFFKINNKIAHVGIYLFNNKFVHAADGGRKTGVIKSSLNEKYYKERFAYAKRLIALPGFVNTNITKSNKMESKEKEEINLIIGDRIYKGKIFNHLKEFNKSTPVYIQVTSQKNNIYFLSLETSNKIILKKIQLNINTSNNIYKSFYLAEGEYIIKLFSINNILLKKQNILVK